MPGIRASWQHDGLRYQVSVITVPDPSLGNFDLYKLELENPTEQPLQRARLIAGVDGPPDTRLEGGVVRGLGSAPFLVVDTPDQCSTQFRAAGLCDKRAKAYATGPGPGPTEPAINTYRVGLDGVPVVYRVKAERDRKYVICLASTPHISGFHLAQPKQSGDLVFEYSVEGCEPQQLDWHDWVTAKPQPLFATFLLPMRHGWRWVHRGAIWRGTASPIRHTRLSAIYVFPENTPSRIRRPSTAGR